MALQTYDWLNRLGILIGFLSFWFVTPEFIGETRLKQWDSLLVSGAIKFKPVWWYFSLIFVISSGSYLWYALFYNQELINASFVIPVFIWGLIDLAISYLIHNADKIISRLSNDAKIRRQFLIIGGILFTISFVLQFLASFKPNN